jgi:hypothetical protein
VGRKQVDAVRKQVLGRKQVQALKREKENLYEET